MADRRALLLVNRRSRQGEAPLEAALEWLRGAGFEFVQEQPPDPRRIAERVRAHAGGADLVILGGGDGTMNAAADALAETGLPLGILPLGTANDLARTLGIPAVPLEAAKVIAAGRRHAIDVGCVNGKCFFNVASIGLSVQLTQRLTGEVKRRWGVLGYPMAGLAALREARVFRADIACDGRLSRVRSIQIAVGNGRHYGGVLVVAEDAAIDDHRLDLYSLPPTSLWGLLRLLPALRRGVQGNWRGVHLASGREIVVETHRPMTVNTDGELTTRTPARFTVLPAAVTVFVPEDYERDAEGGDAAR